MSEQEILEQSLSILKNRLYQPNHFLPVRRIEPVLGWALGFKCK